MNEAHFEIIVVGGGMVGTALARALGQQGRQVALIEAHEPKLWHEGEDYDLRVSAINRNSQLFFERLHAWEGMSTRRVSTYRRMCVWDSAYGENAITFDAAEIGETDLGHIIENRVIQTALSEQMEGVTTYCPARLDAMEIADAQVHLTLADGTRLVGALVIGADGAHSKVRELAGMEREERPYQQKAIVTTLRTERPHQATAWQCFLPTGPVAFLPLTDGQCSLVWSADSELAEWLMSLTDNEFRTELGRATALRLGCVMEVGVRASFPLIGSRVKPYVLPGVALVGDAAHTIHPLAGQGVNLGFKDAALLAQLIGSTHRDIGSMRVLRAYERARRGDNEATMRIMEGFKHLFGSQLPGVAWLRGQGLKWVDGFGPLKRRLAYQALMGTGF